ncbi:MAG: Ig-like domain-containing protein [Terriglobia bacterium]
MVAPIQVTPVLYMADGTEYDLPSITLGTAGIATVNINHALAAAPPALAAHVSQYGSTALRYQYPWGGVVRAQMVVVNIPQSLVFTGPLNAVDDAATSTPQAPQGIETLWWRRDPGVTGFVSLANTTDAPIQARVQATGALGTPGDDITVQLGPHATQILDLDEITSGIPGLENQSGGLSAHYNGADGAVMMLAGLENVQEGYSATLPPYPEAPAPAATTAPILYGAAGMMIGNADPMMGFPSGTRFTPYAVLRNLTAKAIDVHPEVFYMQGASPVAVPLPVQILKPNETRQLDLIGMFPASLKNFSGTVNLALSYTGQNGDVAMTGGSVDQTGTYVFETNPEGLGTTISRDMTYWSIAGGSDTMISLWNPSGQAEDIAVLFYVSGGRKPYRLPVHLEPHALYNIDVMQLAMNGQPDANGTMLPMNSQGSAVIESGKGWDQTMEVGICAGIYNARTGTCAPPCTNCNGCTAVDVTPYPAYCPVGEKMQLTATAYYYNGNQQNITSTASWSSSDPSQATVNSTGMMTGVAAGAPSITATFKNAPIGGRVCNCIGCPNPRDVEGSTNASICDFTIHPLVVNSKDCTNGTQQEQPFYAIVSPDETTCPVVASGSSCSASATGNVEIKVGSPTCIYTGVNPTATLYYFSGPKQSNGYAGTITMKFTLKLGTATVPESITGNVTCP